MAEETTELNLGQDTGVWAVRSSSQTTYYVDLDNRRLLRAPGPGSSRGAFDDCWLHLTSVESVDGFDRIRVGYRHRWVQDPDPGSPCDYIWWVQRMVTALDRLMPDDVPVGRNAATDEWATPFGH